MQLNVYLPVAFGTYPIPDIVPRLGCGGRVGGGALLFTEPTPTSSVAASEKFGENGVGAGGEDIR